MWLFLGPLKSRDLLKKQANRNSHSNKSKPLAVCVSMSLSAVKVWSLAEYLKQLGKQVREGRIESPNLPNDQDRGTQGLIPFDLCHF